MTKLERECIFHDHFKNVTEKSWTWKKLTEEERGRCKIALDCITPIGQTQLEVVRHYESIYLVFLLALDYKPNGWRENEKEVPKF